MNEFDDDDLENDPDAADDPLAEPCDRCMKLTTCTTPEGRPLCLECTLEEADDDDEGP